MKRQSIMKGALLGAVLCAGPSLAQPMPLAELGAGMYRIEAEVAHTAQARQVGLMMRKTMAPQRGMVFVFEHDATHCMWMKNTFLPLSVAFVDAQGKVINIEDMQPQSEDNHCAAAPARFALEMNLGWFREKGLSAGTKVGGIDRLAVQVR